MANKQKVDTLPQQQKAEYFFTFKYVKTSAKHLFYAMFVIKLRTSLKQHKCHQWVCAERLNNHAQTKKIMSVWSKQNKK